MDGVDLMDSMDIAFWASLPGIHFVHKVHLVDGLVAGAPWADTPLPSDKRL